MKLLLISAVSLLCLCATLAEDADAIVTSDSDLDVVELGNDDEDAKPSESQRKRDSGYSYTRPDRFTSSGTRGRIVAKHPGGQTSRPFNRYGPPRSQYPKPSDQYAPQHTSHRQPYRRPRPQSGPFGGQSHQGVPSPIRNHDFVEPSPIAGQNNEPFNSNAANYLPPRNQKLPGYSSTNQFSNQQQQQQQQSTQIFEDHQIQTTNSHHQQQQQQQNFNDHQQHQHQHHQHQPNFRNNHQSQQLVQPQFPDQPQISDAALFLAQNADAITQLYETPATNLNYEPQQDSQTQEQSPNPNAQFQTFGTGESQEPQQNSPNFRGSLPSYASGFLDSRETLRQVQSLEKDRLIVQLQRALAQGGAEEGTTNARYAQNHPGGFAQGRNLLTSFGTQINASPGSQPAKPGGFNGFAAGSFLPTPTASGFPVSYGLPSTTPATQATLITTTAAGAAASPTAATTAQRPPQTATGDGTTQVATSVPAPGSPLGFPFAHQYGGFVPTTLVGTSLLASYPTYGTSFLVPGGSSGSPTVAPVQPAGSAPTHFGLPIPTVPGATQVTTSGTSDTFGFKPQQHPSQQRPTQQRPTQQNPTQQNPTQQHPTQQNPSQQHPTQQNPTYQHPVHAIPVQPIQPIHPVAATPVHPVFPVAPAVAQLHPVAPGHATFGLQPAVTQVHPVQAPVAPGHATFGLQPAVTQVHPVQAPVAPGHATFGLQPAAPGNPLLVKPVKGVYPVYYYPNYPNYSNVYQIQKPAVATLPWSYAPAYAQAKPQQIWK